MKIYLVFQPCDDPYAGADYLMGVYSDKKLAYQRCSEANKCMNSAWKEICAWYVEEGNLNEDRC